MNNFYNRLKLRWNEMGFTKDRLCELIGILPATMTNWKTKNILPNSITLLALSKVLKVSPYWLLLGEEETVSEFNEKEFCCLSKQKKEMVNKFISFLAREEV